MRAFWEGSHIRAAPCLQEQDPRGLFGGQHQATRGCDLLSPGPPSPRPAATGRPKTGTGGEEKARRKPRGNPEQLQPHRPGPHPHPLAAPAPELRRDRSGPGGERGGAVGSRRPSLSRARRGQHRRDPELRAATPGSRRGEGGGSAGMSQENLLGMDEGALRKLVSPPRRRWRASVRGCGRSRVFFWGGLGRIGVCPVCAPALGLR